MSIAAAQLGAIIRYETLMHWRRRSLAAIIGFFLLALIGFSLIDRTDQMTTSVLRVATVEGGVEVTQIDPATGEPVTSRLSEADAGMFPLWMRDINLQDVQNTLRLAFMIAIATQALLIALMPMLAETIPLDKQVKVRELLDTTPLARALYLGGKVLGVWAGLIIGLLLVGVLFGLFCQWRYGSYDLLLYMRLWLAVVLPGALIASGFTIILNALTGSRRAAIVIGIVLIPLAVVMVSSISVSLFINMVQIFDPAASTAALPYDTMMNYFVSEIVNGMALFALALAVVWVGMWGLLRWRQAK